METKKCSDCKSTVLLSYFGANRKGESYKTCDNCRTKHKCDKCEFKCSRKGDVLIHIKRVHDKIKDMKCSIEGCNHIGDILYLLFYYVFV